MSYIYSIQKFIAHAWINLSLAIGLPHHCMTVQKPDIYYCGLEDYKEKSALLDNVDSPYYLDECEWVTFLENCTRQKVQDILQVIRE